MVDYCPGCNRREKVIQALVDAYRVSSGLPGLGISALDLAFRNSPIPGKIMSEGEALRSWLNDYETIFSDSSQTAGGARDRMARPPNLFGSLAPHDLSTPGKKKRKVSRYQREFGRQLKALKKKHPRTKISALMKRAHTATKKALK